MWQPVRPSHWHCKQHLVQVEVMYKERETTKTFCYSIYSKTNQISQRRSESSLLTHSKLSLKLQLQLSLEFHAMNWKQSVWCLAGFTQALHTFNEWIHLSPPFPTILFHYRQNKINSFRKLPSQTLLYKLSNYKPFNNYGDEQ